MTPYVAKPLTSGAKAPRGGVRQAGLHLRRPGQHLSSVPSRGKPDLGALRIRRARGWCCTATGSHGAWRAAH